jgi:MFS family permease
MGFNFVAVQTASYARIAPSDNGRASAIFSTQRQMSVSIGVALMATVLSGFTPLAAAPPDPQRALEGYHWAFAVSTVLALIATAIATRIRDEDAAATMYRRSPEAVAG